MRIDRENISISALFSEISDAWQPQLSEEFTLLCEHDSRCDSIWCDLVRIKQVLNNLLSNAVKYSLEGGLIRLVSQLVGDELWISVQDQGMGISSREQINIFERFQQLESGYSRRAGGLGIGLSLSRKLIDLHGGRIWVESEKGGGSKFIFSLPLDSGDKEP
ncbi:MAG: ATP-binding protein [Nitrospinaceae bacterium]|nr:ATP-binding protein [Nitrospinaceae bacterium]